MSRSNWIELFFAEVLDCFSNTDGSVNADERVRSSESLKTLVLIYYIWPCCDV